MRLKSDQTGIFVYQRRTDQTFYWETHLSEVSMTWQTLWSFHPLLIFSSPYPLISPHLSSLLSSLLFSSWLIYSFPLTSLLLSSSVLLILSCLSCPLSLFHLILSLHLLLSVLFMSLLSSPLLSCPFLAFLLLYSLLDFSHLFSPHSLFSSPYSHLIVSTHSSFSPVLFSPLLPSSLLPLLSVLLISSFSPLLFSQHVSSHCLLTSLVLFSFCHISPSLFFLCHLDFPHLISSFPFWLSHVSSCLVFSFSTFLM